MFHRILLIFSIVLFSYVAIANEVYIIKNVKISGNNKTASIARNMAIEKGQLKAFDMLVKLHYPAAVNKLSKLNKDKILDTVEGFELSEEKRSATNYLAKLKVKFNREDVNKLMNSLGAVFTEAPKKVQLEEEQITPESAKSSEAIQAPPTDSSNTITLIVLIFEQEDRYYGLGDENIWSDLWSKSLEKKANAKFILPIGDLEDLAMLNRDVLKKNLIDLAPLFDRYNVNNLAICRVIDQSQDSMHHLSLQVDYINKYHHAWQRHDFPSVEGSNLSSLLNKSINEVEQFSFNSSRNNSSKISFDLTIVDPYIIAVDYKVEKLSDWVNLEQILTGIRYISNIDLKQITVNNYHFTITANIAVEDLEEMLKKYNLILQSQSGNKYLLEKEVAHAEY